MRVRACVRQVSKFKLQAKASFQFIVDFLRKQLRCKPTDPLVRVLAFATIRQPAGATAAATTRQGD
jgi:hypothetical protein